MAFTQSDIDTLDVALKSNTLEVRFSDGRRVVYQSPTEMMKVREMMLADINATTPRASLAGFSRGLC
jgi:hypothetical protein